MRALATASELGNPGVTLALQLVIKECVFKKEDFRPLKNLQLRLLLGIVS